MTDTLPASDLSSLGTRTYTTPQDGVKEAVIICAPASAVGSDRSQPPNPYDYGFEGALRCSYFHTGTNIGVQFPRWSNEYSLFDVKLALADIVYEDGRVSALYPTDDEGVLRISWVVSSDSWSHDTMTLDEPYDVVIDSYDVLWSAVRTRGTTPLHTDD